MDSWPNFFIVGAPRCGTTSLYEYLKQTLDVFMCPVKEPNYFNVSVNPKLQISKPIRDKKKYLNLFNNVKDEIAIGEASPTYLWDPKAPKLIHNVVPDARIIMILRDPVERAFSNYLFLLGIGGIKSSFSEAIKNALDAPNDFSGRIIESGLYYEQVKRYVEIFGTKQNKIIIFEEFIKETRKSVKEVLEFLGIKHPPPNSIDDVYNPFILPRGAVGKFIVRNRVLRKLGKTIIPTQTLSSFKNILTKEYPRPVFLEKDRKLLQKIYHEDVNKLQKFLGRTLPWLVIKN